MPDVDPNDIASNQWQPPLFRFYLVEKQVYENPRISGQKSVKMIEIRIVEYEA